MCHGIKAKPIVIKSHEKQNHLRKLSKHLKIKPNSMDSMDNKSFIISFIVSFSNRN